MLKVDTQHVGRGPPPVMVIPLKSEHHAWNFLLELVYATSISDVQLRTFHRALGARGIFLVPCGQCYTTYQEETNGATSSCVVRG